MKSYDTDVKEHAHLFFTYNITRFDKTSAKRMKRAFLLAKTSISVKYK